MSIITSNVFTSYEHTDEEHLAGTSLTVTQREVLQNRLAQYAEEKLSTEYDPSDPDGFLQKEAYKKGQIDTIRSILADSEAAIAELTFQANNQ